STNVVFTGSGDVKIKIGPPTSSGEHNCELPGIRKAFSYKAYCSFPPPSVTLTVEKKVESIDDSGTFKIRLLKETPPPNPDNTTTLKAEVTGGHGIDTGNVAVENNAVYY